MTLVASGEVRVGAPADRLPDGVELTAALETASGAPEGTIRVTSVRQLKTNVYRVEVIGPVALQQAPVRVEATEAGRHADLGHFHRRVAHDP